MTLESQVCSLDLAKRLKELGVQQESVLYYADSRKSWKEYNCPPRSSAYDELKFIPFLGVDPGNAEVMLCFGRDQAEGFIAGYNDSEPLSAFTVAELGEMLPVEYHSYRVGQIWFCVTYLGRMMKHIKSGQSGTEADARAKMLIYLLENKLV